MGVRPQLPTSSTRVHCHYWMQGVWARRRGDGHLCQGQRAHSVSLCQQSANSRCPELWPLLPPAEKLCARVSFFFFRQGWASVAADRNRLKRLEADVQHWRETCTRTNAQVYSPTSSSHCPLLSLRSRFSVSLSVSSVGGSRCFCLTIGIRSIAQRELRH